MGTLVGTAVGASATVGTAQLAFQTGFSAWWFSLGMGVGFALMAFLYIKPFYLSGQSTVAQFLSGAYDRNAGMFAGLFSVCGIFFSAAASALVLIPMMAFCFSVGLETSALISLALVICYVFFGGAWATGLAGLFKTGLLYVVLGVSFLLITIKTNGLWPLLSGYSYDPWFNLFPHGFWTDLGGGLGTVIGTMSTQSYIQGMCSAKSQRCARRGLLIASAVTACAAVPGIMIGLFMRARHADILPIHAMTTFIMNYLPGWFAGVSTGMLLIASIGSLAGLVLGMGTIVSSDIIGRFFPRVYKKIPLLLMRAVIFLLTSVILLFAYIYRDALVLDWTILSMCLRGAGVFAPLIIAVLGFTSFSGVSARYAVIFGSAAALLWRIFFPQTLSPLYPGMLVSLLFMLGGYKKSEGKKT
jgi:SSS family solute:Na+ symporter